MKKSTGPVFSAGGGHWVRPPPITSRSGGGSPVLASTELDEMQQLAQATKKFLQFVERQRRRDAGEPLLRASE